MIDLPVALQPWRSMLALLPREVALGLGPSVLRLALAVGRLRVRVRHGDGEPDGFDGLTRRGPYERMLLSEWLLADVAPLEFTRRAALGELAFFELARREPARALASLAVFDAGPAQLGVPRVVQIAALIVLSQRAEAAGASFRWGVVHQPAAATLPCSRAADLSALVAARTQVPARRADIDAWRQRARDEGCEELWFVGSRAVAEHADTRGSAWISIEQLVDPHVRAAKVAVRAPRQGKGEALLDLPDDPLCARVLRDPLETAPPRAASLSPTRRAASNLVWSSTGRKLLARAPGGGIAAFAVPNSPRAGAGRPKLYLARAGTAVAAGWYQRSAVVAAIEGGLPSLVSSIEGPVASAEQRSITVRAVSQKLAPHIDQTVALPAGVRPFAVRSGAPLSPLVLAHYGPKLVPMLCDADGTLFELGGFFDPPIQPVAERVTALACFAPPGTVAFVGRGCTAPEAGGAERESRPPFLLPEGRWSLVACVRHRSERPPTMVPLEGDGTFEAFFGWGSVAAHPELGLVAIHQTPDRWTIHSRGEPIELGLDRAAEVVGVTVDPRNRDAGPALVVLESDRRRLSLVGRTASRTLAPSAEPIVHVAVSHAGPEIGYVTESGRVVVLTTTRDEPLVVHVPAGVP